MPDYIQIGPQPTPKQPASNFSTDQESRSYAFYLMAQYSKAILDALVAQFEKFKKDSRQESVDTRATYKDRAAGDLLPVIRDFTKEAKTPLQIEVEAVIQRYQQRNLKVPNLASSLRPPSEDFSQIIENATGRRSPARPTLVRIDPRSYDFADLLIFAVDRGYGARVSAALRGRHGAFSFHYDGRAIDITVGVIPDKDPRYVIKALSEEEINAIRRTFESVGVRCYDETDKSNWTPETTGYHLHFDTATRGEIVSRQRVKNQGGTRADLGIGTGWPLRVP